MYVSHQYEFQFQDLSSPLPNPEPVDPSGSKGPVSRNDDGAIYMALDGIPKSQEAIALVEGLAEDARKALGKKYAATKPFIEAMGAIVADIVGAWKKRPDALCFRTFGKDTFEESPIGSQAFREAMDGLERLELVTIVLGNRKPHEGKEVAGWATRVRPTSVLLDRIKDADIEASAWKDHFTLRARPAEVPSPLILRKSSIRGDYGRKVKGSSLLVNLSREPAKSAAAQVNRINAFMADQNLDADLPHRFFVRVFNMADDPTFNYNMGGRLISVGHSYQQMRGKPEDDTKYHELRKSIIINGEKTVEVDIKASHPSIIYAAKGLDRPDDPYNVPGVDREIVKQWITMVIGNGKVNRCWSDAARKRYTKRYGKSITKEHDFKAVSELIRKHVSAIEEWLRQPSPTWYELQYVESCVIIDTVEELALSHGVVALPVHDSVIVPRSKQEIAEHVLCKNCERYIGVRPTLSFTLGDDVNN